MPTKNPSQSQALPLVVDLDGTLIRTDLLFETFVAALGSRPAAVLRAALAFFRSGRPGLKRVLAGDDEALDPALLPYHEPLLQYLREQRTAGRELALVSASDHELVGTVAAHLGVFDWYQGSEPGRNLKGLHKASWLSDRLPKGFVYAGDSAADVAVWQAAAGAIPVSAAPRIVRQAKAAAPLEATFATPATSLRDWLRGLRVHQWIKNLVILIPLFLSGRFDEPVSVAVVVAGFLAFSLIASGGYLFNDLLDLSADRRHPSKRRRPLASARISIPAALVMCAVLLFAGVVVLYGIAPAAALLGLIYLLGTVTYTLLLKRLAVVDLLALASLFTLRLAVGTALLVEAYSTWLMTFSLLFFFALSAIKRTTELKRVGGNARRGYRSEDLPLVQSLGVAFTAASLVIFVLYLENEALAVDRYPSPEWLWIAPVAIFLWLCRLWIKASRGELDDDPVVFAVRDPASIAIGGLLGFAVLAAHLL